MMKTKEGECISEAQLGEKHEPLKRCSNSNFSPDEESLHVNSRKWVFTFVSLFHHLRLDIHEFEPLALGVSGSRGSKLPGACVGTDVLAGAVWERQNEGKEKSLKWPVSAALQKCY